MNERGIVWVGVQLDKLTNEIDDVRDDLADAVPINKDADLTKHGLRMSRIQDRMTDLSELAERIFKAVQELQDPAHIPDSRPKRS